MSKKSIIKFWLKSLHSSLLGLLYDKKQLKTIKLTHNPLIKSSYYPPLFPKKNINDNTITNYMELQNIGKLWKY